VGWTLSRIQEATGVRRETISGYLKAAGIPVRGRGRPSESKPKPAISPEVSTDSRAAKPAISQEGVDRLRTATTVLERATILCDGGPHYTNASGPSERRLYRRDSRSNLDAIERRTIEHVMTQTRCEHKSRGRGPARTDPHAVVLPPRKI